MWRERLEDAEEELQEMLPLKDQLARYPPRRPIYLSFSLSLSLYPFLSPSLSLPLSIYLVYTPARPEAGPSVCCFFFFMLGDAAFEGPARPVPPETGPSVAL